MTRMRGGALALLAPLLLAASHVSRVAAFTCDGGATEIPDSHVDDEYCDCDDGTDEPRTGACPGTPFHCFNKPHRPREIFASRVNDGVCDCCDGSDEWKRGGCPNACVELAKADLAKNSKASLNRVEREVSGQQAAVDRRAKLAAAHAALGTRGTELDALRAAKVAAEEAEAAAKADRERRLAAGEVEAALKLPELSDEALQAALARLAIAKHVDGADALHEKLTASSISDGMDDVDSADLIEIAMEAKEASTAFEKEEEEGEARDKAPQACVEAATVCGFEAEMVKLLPLSELPRDELQRIVREFAEETSQMAALTKAAAAMLRASAVSVDEAVLSAALELLEPFGYPAADEARAALTAMEASLSSDNATLMELEPLIAREAEFGEKQEWYTLFANCFTSYTSGFEYRLCPFSTFTQGGLSLGTYRGWQDPGANELTLRNDPNIHQKVMAFEDGEPCDGTPRRARVLFECGAEDQLVSISEPSTCVYEGRFTTPSACSTDAVLKQHHELAEASQAAGLQYEPDEAVKALLARA